MTSDVNAAKAADKNSLVDKLMQAATQLLVADRLKTPMPTIRAPLTKEEARAYVMDAAMVFGEAHRFIEDVENELTKKRP